MAFSDGDAFVSGSLLSFQQANRMMQNFRGASVPSNLQDGALWSDSDDDRLYHQGAALDEVFTEQTTLTWENLISNSGFGVWSQSDTNKGIATIAYDSGGNTALVVGETLTGNTSGATCKVISYTTVSGTWAGGDAAGIITVGACSVDFAWVDNETVTGSAAGADAFTVNEPDSGVGVGLVQNGGFPVDTDPPPGWTQGRGDEVLTTEAGGQVGNCFKITEGGTANPYAYQDITGLTIGKIYKFSIYIKEGTESTYTVWDVSESQFIMTGEATAAWVLHTATFEATATSFRLGLKLTCGAASGLDMYFDEITLYEITPCCTAANALAHDTWEKDSTIDIYREHWGDDTKDGSFYALKLVPSTAADYVKWPGAYFVDAAAEQHYAQYQSRTVTFGAWVKTSEASHVKLGIYDGAYEYSSYHTGEGDWEWLEVTNEIGSGATNVQIRIICDQAGQTDGTTIAYISQPMLVFGSHIGEGNYQPKPQEIIQCEKAIPSNALNSEIGLSDLAFTTINSEADSDAMLPKGVKGLFIYSAVRDSGSAGNPCHLAFRGNVAMGYQNIVSSGALTNDYYAYSGTQQYCDENGDFQYAIEASGAGTFDVGAFLYHGIRVN